MIVNNVMILIRNRSSLNSNAALDRWDNFIKGFQQKNMNATLLVLTFRRYWIRYQQRRKFSASRIQTYIRKYLAKKRVTENAIFYFGNIEYH